jgi:hypothetical protein
MAAEMTLDELRDYIHSMPEDEILCITLKGPGGKEEGHAGEKESG